MFRYCVLILFQIICIRIIWRKRKPCFVYIFICVSKHMYTHNKLAEFHLEEWVDIKCYYHKDFNYTFSALYNSSKIFVTALSVVLWLLAQGVGPSTRKMVFNFILGCKKYVVGMGNRLSSHAMPLSYCLSLQSSIGLSEFKSIRKCNTRHEIKGLYEGV